ncbi:TPA: DUF2591 family protein [Enterobacter asburiae]|nr:DUF2591 family protein [Enterobacter asburiae]
MKYGSVCSGIEAASKAWEPLGWKPAWFSEIEPFPSTEWAQCGPMMESLSISCYQSADPATGKLYHWVGVNELVSPGRRRGLVADNPRTAICRAVVFAKLGHVVDIPDELAEKEPA